MKISFKFLSVMLFVVTLVCGISCQELVKKDPTAKALEQIVNVAEELNKQCPMTQKNGTTLVSVECVDSQLVYICKVPNSYLSSISKSKAASQIVDSISDKMKQALALAHCSILYRYMSDYNSVDVVITPDEIQEAYTKNHPAE